MSVVVKLVIAGLLLVVCGLADAQAPSSQPVMVGPKSTIGCNTGMEGVGLYRFGHQHRRSVPIMAGPGSNYAQIDRLKPGMYYRVCERVDGAQEQWVPIIYTDDAQQDCQIAAQQLGKRPYAGPCRSGWLARSIYATETAG